MMKRLVSGLLMLLLTAGPSWSQSPANTGCAGQSRFATVYTNINVTGNTQLITGIVGTRIAICHVHLIVALADNVALVEGTGATCGTNTLGLFGGATAATGWNIGANGGLVMGDGYNVIRRSAVSGNNVCILVSAATQASGLIVWVVE